MSKKVHLCLKDKEQRIVAWCAGYSDRDIEELLKKHPDWHRSSYEESGV